MGLSCSAWCDDRAMAKPKTSKRAAADDSLPRPTGLEAERLAQRFAFPAYAQHDAVRAMVEPSRASTRERIDALIERCVARSWIPSDWLTGRAPRCIGSCDRCGHAGLCPDGTIVSHEASCPHDGRPRSLEFAVSLVAEAIAQPRATIVDAEALAAEWMRAINPWGAPPFCGVLWAYEAHTPQLISGWDGVCDLQPTLLLPALAAARVVRGKPALWYGEASAPGFGAFTEHSWMLEVLEPIEREARARKRPGGPRRVLDDAMLDLLGYALEGASLWQSAVERNATVTLLNVGRSAARAGSIPRALVGKRFATLPNPWTALLALLATGALPVGASGGWLALNLLPFETD